MKRIELFLNSILRIEKHGLPPPRSQGTEYNLLQIHGRQTMVILLSEVSRMSSTHATATDGSPNGR